MLEIIATPVGDGRYDAHVEGRYLLTSRQPFFDGARVLQAQGVPSETPLGLRHAGSETIALRWSVGLAAGLTVEENDKGIAIRPHRPWMPEGSAPAADADPEAPTLLKRAGGR